MNRYSYGLFVEILLCGFYVFFIQGRISGFMDLRISQLPELMSEERGRAAFSKVFKNSAQRLLQVIAVPEVCFISAN